MIKFILASYIFIVIKRYLYSKFLSIGLSLIIFFILSTVLASANTNTYIKMSKTDNVKDIESLNNANEKIFGFYLLIFLFMITSFGDIPDTFYISFIVVCIIIYSSSSSIAKDNILYLLKHYSSLFFICLTLYGLIINIGKKNTRTINTMNIILVCSILIIYVTTIKFIDKLLLPDFLSKYLVTNYESINYLYDDNGNPISSNTDCNNFNSDESICI